MKTFTEFSTLVLRRAAAAKAANASLEGDALVEALAAALGTPADRVPRLLEALEITGDNLDNIRLVRVYQGETGPHGAVSRGEFHYALDRVVGSGRGGRDRGDRGGRGGDRGGRGGDRGDRGGGGGMGGERRDKPRGLGSLMKTSGEKSEGDKDDRPARGEIPRAGIGWQLTSAPRDYRDDKGGRPRKGGPRPPGRGRPGGGPGGPGGPGGDDRGRRGPRPMGDRPPRGPRPEGAAHGAPRDPSAARPPRDPGAPRPPRDPNAVRPPRDRRPLGPDANGLGPDGKPWDPDRKSKRDAERATRLATGPVPSPAPSAAPESEPSPPAEE